jgi:flagellar M-ring protein FliF
MTWAEHAERLWASLLKLGTRRLALLGAVGAAVFAVTGLAGYLLSRPADEVLYAGLDRQDVSNIGAALGEANIAFDVNADGNTVLVRSGAATQARMLLAEKGLPHSANAGYELFDKLGSLGLTSFMQEVTRVRALEGELARSIQSMAGVRAARVHIVLPDSGSFRRSPQPPSASVLIRTESVDDARTAQAVRHLVSAAVPGMTVDEVTVLSSDGAILAAGNDVSDSAPSKVLNLEKTVSQELQDNIRKTLTPYLGLRNFQISVATKLNTDSKQTAETIYNPDSRVERSVRVVKESQTSQNSSGQPPTTVDQNLPQDKTHAADGKQANEDNQKREELTNYELSSKTITTVSGGYEIEHISIAVLVNRASLMASLGDKAPPELFDKRLIDIEQLATSAAGLHKERGDSIKVSAVDFVEGDRDLEPVAGPGFVELALRHSGSVVNAATVLGVALLLIWFGLRPFTRAMLAQRVPAAAADTALTVAEPYASPQLEGAAEATHGNWGEQNLIEDLTSKPRRSPQKRLEQIVEFDEEQAAAILKQWVHQGTAA